jgi:hypothetical protein
MTKFNRTLATNFPSFNFCNQTADIADDIVVADGADNGNNGHDVDEDDFVMPVACEQAMLTDEDDDNDNDPLSAGGDDHYDKDDIVTLD